MSGWAPLRLPPTAPDLALARLAARHASAPMECTTRVLTWFADEKIVLAAVTGAWAYCHLALRTPDARRWGNQMALKATIAAAAGHLLKRLVDRERPDRKVVGLRRHGIPRSGTRWDSFPSGHAVHLGALAASLDRVAPRWRRLVWPVSTALAATRVLLLAHYLSDVAAGLALGIAIDRSVNRIAARLAFR